MNPVENHPGKRVLTAPSGTYLMVDDRSANNFPEADGKPDSRVDGRSPGTSAGRMVVELNGFDGAPSIINRRLIPTPGYRHGRARAMRVPAIYASSAGARMAGTPEAGARP
jgi:hypothetical protein